MFKSTRKSGIIVTSLIAFAVLGSACAATPNALANYTGEAIVKEHHRSGKSCYATVVANGIEAKVRVGRKTVCPSFKDNVKVKIEKGTYKGNI